MHAHRLVVEDAGRVARRAADDRDRCSASTTRWRRSPTSCSRACSCASRSSSSRTPRARSAGSRTRSSGPTTCGSTTRAGRGAKETIPEPPSTLLPRPRSSAASRPTAHGVVSIAEVGEDNICFETDYPHTDTTWPFAREEVGADDRVAHRRAALQGPARQRDPDARPRPNLSSATGAAAAPRPWRQKSHVSSAVTRMPAFVGEPVAEPAVHHRLLHERGGPAACRSRRSRRPRSRRRRRARPSSATAAPSRPSPASGWSTASCTENSMIGRRLCVPRLRGLSDGSHHSCRRIVNARSRSSGSVVDSTTARGRRSPPEPSPRTGRAAARPCRRSTGRSRAATASTGR